jgi:hypothetical protein
MHLQPHISYNLFTPPHIYRCINNHTVGFRQINFFSHIVSVRMRKLGIRSEELMVDSSC